MSSLAHPRGPEPERVYWLRRAIVVVALVATLLLLGWIVRTLFGGQHSTAGAAPTPNNSSLAGPPTVTPSMQPTPSGSPSASTSGTPSASVSGSPSATPTPSASSANPNATCDPSTVGVTVSANPTSVGSGSTTQVLVKFTNSAQTACKIDFTAHPMSLTITSGSDHIWSANDCERWAPHGLTDSLKPGSSFTFTEPWATKRSASGCTLKSSNVLPGTYVATGGLTGGQTSSRIIMVHG